MKRTPLVRRSDDGAILIFALIIITTVALVTGSLMTTGWTNFASTVTLRSVAGQAYAGDAAAKLAINDMVWGASSTVPATVASYPSGPLDASGHATPWSYDNNTDGTGCFGKNASTGAPLDRLTFAGVGVGQAATVVCTPVTGTGIFAPGKGDPVPSRDPSDPYARSLTTLGTTTCLLQGTGTACNDGITLKGLGAGTEIPIRASIESNSFINVQAGTLRTNGTITANPNSACTTSNSGAIVPSCSGSFITPAAETSPLTSVPTYRDPSAQSCGNFQPGFYNSGAALSAAVNACGTAHFASGIYYFDFADNQPWDISTTVIGGELTGGTSTPGRCKSPIDSPSGTPGVQFVFGGKSYVQVEDAARVELCGPENGGNAPLTIFQQQTGTSSSPSTITPVASANVTTLPDQNNLRDAFTTNPNSATLTAALAGTAAPNSTATWKSSARNNTGELDLQNFAGLSAIPVGSTITSAKLNVAYTNGLSAGGTFTAGVAGQATTVPVAASGTDTDLTALLNAQFQGGAFTATNPKLQLVVANSLKNDTFSVDAVTLSVTYIAPALHPATTAATFITDHGGNLAGQFVVQGATYAPKGYITLTPGSSSNALVAFRWGVVAWGVNFKSQPSQVWGYPLVSIPDVSPGPGNAVTDVDMKVFLCSGAGPCPTTGAPVLTTRVQFTDGVNSKGWVTPVAGQRQVSILSWAEQR